MTDTPISNTSTVWQNDDNQGHIVIAQAEADFSQAQQSLHSPKTSDKVAYRDSSSIDLEKGHDGSRQEAFDLREYLTSSNDANSAAGIKHKHVGVTWEDLEVLGIGGEGDKVCHLIRFPRVPFSSFVSDRFTCLHTQVSNFDSVSRIFPEFLNRRSH